jgi:FAM32A
MPSEDYASVPSSGKLKLKGVKDAKISKKKKHKDKCEKVDKATPGDLEDRSVVLKKLEDEEKKIENDNKESSKEEATTEATEQKGDDAGIVRSKTEAERRYEEQRRKRVSFKAFILYQAILAAAPMIPLFRLKNLYLD